MRKHRYLNQNTHEVTDCASIALAWHNAGDRVQCDTLNPSGSLRRSTVIEGAKVETERERFDRVEGRERCESIARELNAYADGYMHRCPECDEVLDFPDGVGDKFKCPNCGNIAEIEDYEELSMSDYLDDVLDVDYTVNRYAEYSSCSVCVGWGGPNIYIDTSDAYVRLYWGNTREQYPIHYSTRDLIDEWAEEAYNCAREAYRR